MPVFYGKKYIIKILICHWNKRNYKNFYNAKKM